MNIREILEEEYDVIHQISENTFVCTLEYLEETHIITVKGNTLHGYNEATGHRWELN